MLISIAILAYNEERRIATTIRSLLSQSVFQGQSRAAREAWEIIVVPNGCIDQTHAAAEAALQEGIRALKHADVSGRVVSLDQRGKSHAWNKLVHEIARPATDVFVFVDADVVFGDSETIENAVGCLLTSNRARAVVDLPVNDLNLKRNPSHLERFLARASLMKLEGPVGLAGSFYCARGAILREIWMPVGLASEDGFLATMIWTDCFRSRPVAGRIARAEQASHYYEGLSTLSQIIRHEVRLAIGTALNAYLCWDTLAFVIAPGGAGAGELIRTLNHERPGWYPELIANAVSNRGWWIVPRGMLRDRIRDRLRGWSKRGALEKVREIPLRLGAIVLEVLILCAANRKLRKNVAVGYW